MNHVVTIFRIIKFIVDSSNYRKLLKWCDYIVLDELKLTPTVIDLISERLKVPIKELRDIIEHGAEQKGAGGI